MDFEAYLISKKIDTALFLKAEPDTWSTWKQEFDQMHPNSFTSQKLYLINPVRRKYPLKDEPVKKPEPVKVEVAVNPEVVKTEFVVPEVKSDILDGTVTELNQDTTPPIVKKPAVPRPVFKPKPKTT